MSKLTYNGVSLSYIHTHSFEQEAVYTDDHADYLYTHVRIAAQAVLNESLLPAVKGEHPGGTIARVRHALLTPRGDLSFTVGNDDLIPEMEDGDAKNGPLPISCNITEIGEATFLIDYAIETWIDECADGKHPPYLSVRFSEEVAMDESFYTTRTRRGKLYVRRDVTANPDTLREQVIALKIPPGFQRVSSTYTMAEDGCSMDFSIVDREVYLEPPQPATKATGELIASTPNGAKCVRECHVTLEGAKTTSKADLISKAVLIAFTKAKGGDGVAAVDPNGTARLMGAAIKESLWENKVEVSCKFQVLALTDRLDGGQVTLKPFGVAPPGCGPGTPPPDYGVRGTANILLQVAALSDPCMAVAMKQTAIKGGGPDGVAPVPAAQVLQGPPRQTDNLAQFKQDGFGIYGRYKVSNLWRHKNHVVALAIASPNGFNGADTAFCQMAAARLERVVDWEVERTGAKPKIPDPIVDGNHVLIDADIEPESIELAADGESVIHRVSGRYTYGIKQRSGTTLRGGKPAYISSSKDNDTTIEGDQFVKGIIDTGANATGEARIPKK